MKGEEFVRRIREVVYESSIEGCLSLLEMPPGRQPSPALVRLSQWFNGLSPDDKESVRATVQLAVRGAVHGMLTVLDGVTSIRRAEEEDGAFELRYQRERQSALLNDPNGEFLHDLFAQQVPPA